jgi:hypothetical protein
MRMLSGRLLFLIYFGSVFKNSLVSAEKITDSYLSLASSDLRIDQSNRMNVSFFNQLPTVSRKQSPNCMVHLKFNEIFG